MTFSEDACGPIDICIVHDVGGTRAAGCLANILRHAGAVSVLQAQPSNIEPPLLKSVQGLGARLALTDFSMRDGGRLAIIGVGAAGEAVGRGLAAYLLGQDVAVEALYSLSVEPDDDVGASVRETFPHIDFDTPQPCWSEGEDARRIKRFEGLSLVEGAECLRTEIEAVARKPRGQAGGALLLPLRPSRESEAEIFCIPGAGASVISFLDLAQLAPGRFSTIGLQPRGLDGRDPPYTSVEAAAVAFDKLISERSSAEAAHLVGHSYGGCIAFQLASRLRARGKTPASLTLIDSRPPRNSRWPVDLDDAEVALGWIRMSEQAAQRSLGIDEEQLRPNDLAFNLRLVQDGMVRAGLLPPNTMADTLVGPMRMFAACVRRWFHTESIYPGPLRLIYLDDPRKDDAGNAETAREVREGWSRLAPQLSFCRGPGNHITGLKNPHARDLIKLMGWESIEALA